MDLLIQDSPDSSTSPRVKLLATAADKSTEKKEEKVLVKKQKTRTVFSQTQLCVLNDRFQRQKYLSLQQMQELSNILNLSYKQVWLFSSLIQQEIRNKVNFYVPCLCTPTNKLTFNMKMELFVMCFVAMCQFFWTFFSLYSFPLRFITGYWV